jgi:hypothetical protein
VGTLTTSGTSTTVTLSGGSTSQFVPNSYLMLLSGGNANGNMLKVASITNSTSFVVTMPINLSGGTSFEISAQWAAGNCGFLWMTQNHTLAPFTDPYNYAPGTGVQMFGDANITLHFIQSLIHVGLALADDDPRAVEILAMAYAYYYDNQFGPIEKNMWTGFNQSRVDYMGATEPEAAQIAAAITNSVNNPPDLISGVYLQRVAALGYYINLPFNELVPLWWGDPGQASWTPAYIDSWSFSIGLYPTTTEAKYANWWMRNQWGFWSPSNINYGGGWHTGPAFIFLDPAYQATDIATAPHQYLFRATDQASCGNYGFTCPAYKQYGNVISRTGLKSATDTLAFFDTADFYADDHTRAGEAGEVQIVKNSYLLGGDSQGNNSYAVFPGTAETPEFGGSNASLRQENVDFFDTQVLRWAGADPTGDPNNNYTYALAELVCTFRVPSINGCPTASDTSQPITRVQRHFLHFKKPGLQDYILQYDDWAASAGTTMRTYLHYALNGANPGSAISFAGGASGATITNTQPSSRLLSTVVTPAGANTVYTYVDNTNGTYSGGNGYTFRVSLCAGSGSCSPTATAFEAIVVHQPTASTAATMPAVTQLPSTNFRVVQVADSAMPKVAAFAQGGTTYAGASFQTSFTGTGQYVIAGLSPGTYTVTVGSNSPTSGTVAAGDNTLYFEAGSGLVVITSTGGAPPPPPPTGPPSAPPTTPSSCDLNGDGVVNNLDVQIAMNQAMGVVACTNANLQGNGQCNVIDVIRVFVAANGGACVLH